MENQSQAESNNQKIKILFVASEAAPFAKAGGLGDVVFSLPLALKKMGQDVRVMIPRYGTIDPQKNNLKIEKQGLRVPTDQPGDYPYLVCNVKKYAGKKSVPTYFLENMEYYEKRANVYGYSDDHIRWVLLSRGALEFIKKSKWKPDIIVASDWQTGLISNYLKTKYKEDQFLSKIPVVFVIHNLYYQGMCDFRFSQESDRDSGIESLPDFFNPRLAKLNWMLRGIMHSDAIITVSPNYAKEILTPEYGEGLDKLLSEKRDRLFGILNAIDYEVYNPKTTTHIPFNYASEKIEMKEKNKIELQKILGLPQDPAIPLIGMVSRMTEQKGFDLLEKIIKPILKYLPVQMVCVGDGEPRYKEMLKGAIERFPQKISCRFEFDHFLPHLVFAASDIFLMPSKFEPCGLTQMQAMRYGAISIVRKTGGLVDTVIDFIPEENKGDGFLFEDYESISLFATICRACACFSFKKSWKKLVKRAMTKDFSWKHSAKEYLRVFKTVLNKKTQ